MRVSLVPLLAILTATLVAVTLAISAGFHEALPVWLFPAGGPALLVGGPAPSFPLRTLYGGRAALSDYRGQVVLVNLWASWCAPCRGEAPDLERLYQTRHQRGFIVLGVDEGETADAAITFARELGVSYPILIDLRGRYAHAYAPLGFPTSVLVDRDGKVVKTVDGARSFEEFETLVDPLLAVR